MLRSDCAPTAGAALFGLLVVLSVGWVNADERHGQPSPPALPADEAQVLRALARKVSLPHVAASLDVVLQQLAEQAKVQILIDRRALDDGGVSAEQVEIAFDVKNVSLRSAVERLANVIPETRLPKRITEWNDKAHF